MKRSRAVRLTLVASASSACASPAATPSQALHCVERGTNRVVADSLCDAARVASNGGRTGAFGATSGSSGDFGASDGSRALAGPGHAYSGTPYVAPFLWYYGGRVASGFASAGGYAPLGDARYRSPGGFVAGGARRGFFGRAFGGARSSAGEAGHGAVSRGGFGATTAAHGSGGHGS